MALGSIAHRVLKTLFAAGPSSRSDIARTTGLNPATVTRITQALLKQGYIRSGRARVNRASPGRRAVELHLRTDRLFAAGVVMTAYEQSVALVDLTGRPVAKSAIEWSPGQPAVDTLARFAERIEALADDHGIAASQLVGISLACVGTVDIKARRILRSPDIGWFDVSVVEPFAVRLDVPLVVDTMQNTINVAERAFGRAAGAANAMLVSIGLGIGSSLILGNQLIHQTANTSSTFGHMPIAEADELCNCGRYGCLTTRASGYAVLRALDLVGPYREPGSHAPGYAALLLDTLASARRGNDGINEALADAGRTLGEALKAGVAVAMPDAIILAGPVAHLPAYSTAVGHALAPSARDPFGWQGELIISHLDPPTAAGRLALKHFVYDDGQDDSITGLHDFYKNNASLAANVSA